CPAPPRAPLPTLHPPPRPLLPSCVRARRGLRGFRGLLVLHEQIVAAQPAARLEAQLKAVRVPPYHLVNAGLRQVLPRTDRHRLPAVLGPIQNGHSGREVRATQGPRSLVPADPLRVD